MAVELDFSLLFEERLIQPQESLHDRLRGTGVAAFKRAGAEIPHLSGDGKNSMIVCFYFLFFQEGIDTPQRIGYKIP